MTDQPKMYQGIRRFHFYHKDSGAFAEHVYSASEPELALNTPADHVAFEGSYDHLSQRVNVTTGAVEDYQPPAPSTDYEWDTQVRRWQLNPEVAAAQEARRATLAEIARLEGQQGRAVREAVLTGNHERLAALDAQIAQLRASLSE